MYEGVGPHQQRLSGNVTLDCQRLCSQAFAALNTGAIGQASRLADRAIALADDSALAGDTRRSVRLFTLRCAATISDASGASAEALGYIEKASTIAAIGAPPTDPVLHELSLERARLLHEMNRIAEVESCWSTLISRVSGLDGDPLLELDARMSHAGFLRSRAMPVEAAVEMTHAFTLLPRINQTRTRDLVGLLMSHAGKLGEAGLFNEAALLSGEALDRLASAAAEGKFKAEGDYRDEMRWRHGDFLLKAGRIAKARDVQEALLKEWSGEYEASHPKLMQLRDDLSSLEAELGLFSRALEFARENLRIALDDGGETYELTARVRIATIFRLQGRHRDAYSIMQVFTHREVDDAADTGIEELSYDEDERDSESLEIKLRQLDSFPMPVSAVRKSQLLADSAMKLMESDPETALELVSRAQSELDVLAPGITQQMSVALGNIRARAVATMGGLPKQIEFEERRLADFERTHGCSAEMTRQHLRRDLAELYVQNQDYEVAERLLREIKGFLDLREGKETLLYGTVLVALGSIASSSSEAQSLRERGKEIIDSFGEQTDFE